MSAVDVAILDQPGLTFAVLRVPDDVIEHQWLIDEFVAEAVLRFKCRVVLMGERHKRKYGRPELLTLLEYVNLARLPWQKMVWPPEPARDAVTN